MAEHKIEQYADLTSIIAEITAANEQAADSIKAVEKRLADMAVQVNTELLSTYWNIGKIIVEHEQENKDRADYGKQTLKELSKELTKEFGKGFSVSNLQFMRRFYQSYRIQQAVSVKLSWLHYCVAVDDFRSGQMQFL